MEFMIFREDEQEDVMSETL